MTSLSAVSALEVPLRFVACIGFGVDSYHGVCHAHFLENVATLERDGAYLGSFSVPRISALMGIYFTFDLPGVARRSLYLERLANTETIFDVSLQIEAFRDETKARPRRTIPH
jgi:hypothetical protein